jgi:hypothetical protein
MHPTITREEVRLVAAAIKAFFKTAGKGTPT